MRIRNKLLLVISCDIPKSKSVTAKKWTAIKCQPNHAGTHSTTNTEVTSQFEYSSMHVVGKSFRAMPTCRRQAPNHSRSVSIFPVQDPQAYLPQEKPNLSPFQVGRMEWYHSNHSNQTRWCLPNYKLVLSPWTIDISTINPNSWSYKHL